ncbi:ABC transporter substrate-binding protein [Actinoallomurus iriomotensis]|uniref:ABC transporter substrate-binding protein n=1 Tax=Actinoallomurus iriomotensis TaxID=478107 RepID=A0A9W6VPW5_9ACTN|nr:extracellular solute-binding protein [Actinoallomurus iriomotensis]GLY75264.1 ABC transporter substrate-binding protein [Actinoallomurus iriomotensis]
MNIGRRTAPGPSRRDFMRLSGAAGAALGLSACGFGRSDGGGSALKVWDQFTTSPQNEAVRKVYDLYRRSSGVTIDRTTQPGDQMTTVGKTALASGTGPDVIYYEVGKGNAGVLAEAGLLLPLDDLAAEHGWLNKITPFAQREARLDGKLYGLPNETETTALFYNKTLIDKSGLTVPRTFDELLSFCAKAKAKKLIPIAYGQADVYPCWWAFSLMTNNIVGGRAMGDLVFDGKGSWNTPQMKQAIQLFFVDLVKAGAFIDGLNSLHGPDAQSMFLSGKALMNLNGTWAVGAVEKGLPGQEVGIMPMPSIDGGDRVYPAGTGSAYYISAKSKRGEEAGAFLDSLYQPEALRVWVEQGKIFPPVPFDSSGWSLSPLQKQALGAAQNGGGDATRNLGYSVNHGKASPGFLNAMTSGFQAVVQGRKTPARQADDLQKAWEKGR